MRRTIVLLLAIGLLATSCSVPASLTSEAPTTVTAVFPRSANLFVGSEVRVLGLQVGEVADIQPMGDRVEVTLSLDPTRDYPADASVALQPVSLLGERFAQLDPPYTGGPTLETGAVIPIERTIIPAEVDEVLRSFEEFLDSLDAGALAELVDVLADTLDGNGEGLNDLVSSGAETVRVLADSSVDLNQVVGDLADLNETLATREERIGSTLTNASTVLRNLQEDRELLIGALTELTRATAELEPLIMDQSDPLVRDLDILATTLSTVDRNLARVGSAFFGARRLFGTAERAIDFPNARLGLDNEFGPLADFINQRVANRLVGLCIRLELADCASIDALLETVPDLCLPPLCSRPEETTTFAEALGMMVSQLSPPSQAAIAEEIGEIQAAAPAPEAAPAPAPPPVTLPAPDPRLEGRGSTPQVPPSIPGFTGGDQ